ncbi:hypothetical protein BT96DRAFT_977735 [Gymnopus androsaceus JB14]|uniref:Mid2 domain-containing protein n=1 Tax=Gymnopus androsaceus JB14 TaxID=1447944 RepID=A0A6A4HE89_9AGAR|nr:hypothetical protein BT96DRAFT_977735 [Gymnopus androsaceus JB14]
MANFTPDIIIDDQTLLLDGGSYFTYTQSWSGVTEPGLGLYDNTSTISLNATIDVGLNLTFAGVSATIFGFFSCLPDFTSCPYSATLDINPSQVLSAPSSAILYQGSGFSNGSHVLQLVFGSNQTSVEVNVDYALVQPSGDTDLSLDTLYVDHNSTNVIQYTGDWKVSADGSTRDSTTSGDKIWFPFYGNDITVLGYLHQNTIVGDLTFSVSIDNETTIPISILTNSSATDIPFYTYFNARFASNAPSEINTAPQDVNHTIAIEVQQVTGTQKFSFSAFQFTPNFKTLNSMPELPEAPSTSTTTTSTSTSSSSSVTPTHSPAGSPATHNNHTRAIVGAVVGSLAGLILLALVVFIIRKRRRRSTLKSQAELAQSQLREHRDKPNTYPYAPVSDLSPHSNSQMVTSPLTSSPITPFTKRYNNDLEQLDAYPPNSSHSLNPASAGSGITPFSKSYNTDMMTPVSPLPPGAAPSLTPGHRSPAYQPSAGTSPLGSISDAPSQLPALAPLRQLPPPPLSLLGPGLPPANELGHGGESVPPAGGGELDEVGSRVNSSRFPTRRRMMEMIERLNYQVQALSTQNPAHDGQSSGIRSFLRLLLILETGRYICDALGDLFCGISL